MSVVVSVYVFGVGVYVFGVGVRMCLVFNFSIEFVRLPNFVFVMLFCLHLGYFWTTRYL